MKRWFGPALLALAILCTTCVWAQNDTGTADTGQTDTNTPSQPGPKPAYTYPDATPSLDFLNGAVENSSLTLGIGAGLSYVSYGNSNALLSNQNRWQFHVTPSIRIQQFRPKVSWNLGYIGGYQTYTQPSSISSGNYNLYSQNANGGVLWQMARHWQLAANESYIYSADPFNSYLTRVGTPTLNNPNPVSFTPLTQYTINNGLLTLTDQLTKTDTLTFSGTSDYRHTTTYNLVTTSPFYNLISYGGRASYSHRLSPRLSLGAGYDYNSLDFGNGQQRSGIQSIQLTGDYLLRPNMSISGWIGPQYTSTKTIVCIPIPIGGQIQLICAPPSYNSLWSTAFGANFGWRDARNSVQAGFTRGVSDGGGILATVQSNSVNGSYRRMFTKKMDVLQGARYSHLVSTTVSARHYDYFSANASINYRLTKSLSASGQYAFIHYDQSSAILLGTGTYGDSIIGASISYTWNHPLGR